MLWVSSKRRRKKVSKPRGLRKSAAAEEKKVEAQKGSDLAKGPDALKNDRRARMAKVLEEAAALKGRPCIVS